VNLPITVRSLTLAGVGLIVPILVALLLGSDARPPQAQEGPGQQALPADVDSARAILGASLPEVHAVIPGLRRSGIGIDPILGPAQSRAVHVSYALDSKNVVLLSVRRGSSSAEGSPFELPSATATVVTSTIADGTQDVRYAWNQNGLALVLHVNLSHGLTRSDADAIAVSIR
jgi:hypothetical protein